MESHNTSVRSLPPGKLSNIRQKFEDGGPEHNENKVPRSTDKQRPVLPARPPPVVHIPKTATGEDTSVSSTQAPHPSPRKSKDASLSSGHHVAGNRSKDSVNPNPQVAQKIMQLQEQIQPESVHTQSDVFHVVHPRPKPPKPKGPKPEVMKSPPVKYEDSATQSPLKPKVPPSYKTSTIHSSQILENKAVVPGKLRQVRMEKTEKIPQHLQSNTNGESKPVKVSERTKMFESSGGSCTSVQQPAAKSQKANVVGAESQDISSTDRKSDVVMREPPKKPPRTHKHDEYLQSKFINSGVFLIENENYISGSEVGHLSPPKNVHAAEKVKSPGDSKKTPNQKSKRPTRPPPPRPRPFSIATDHVPGLDAVEPSQQNTPTSSIKKNYYNPSYEDCLPVDFSGFNIESESDAYNTLPRKKASPRYPLRRSYSSEWIIVQEVSEPIYLDPAKALHKDPSKSDYSYQVYVDEAGYAVPNKFLKKRVTETTSCQPGDESKPPKPILKRMLSDGDDAEGSNAKRKLNNVKLRINAAFAVLSRYVKRKSETEDDKENDQDFDNISNESESLIDESEIQRRVEYCSTVKIRSKASVKTMKKFEESIYPQLFEYALIVGLRENENGPGYVPHILHKFPEIIDNNVSIPEFCFPDAAEFHPSNKSSKSQSYSFVLTNIDGGRMYGYCRRLMPTDSSKKIPEVVCIISPLGAFNMYFTLLDEIERRRVVSIDHAQELIASAFGRPLPSPGKNVCVRALDIEGEMQTFLFKRPNDTRIEGVNYDCMLNTLGVDKLIKVYSDILLERCILFCAKNLSWQHTFIPVLPPSMLDVVCSPAPYIIGILSPQLPQVMNLPLGEIIIVDLDKKQLIQSVGDESTILPKKLQKALKTALNICKIDAEAKKCQHLMITEAFLRLFVETIGHFGEYIVTMRDGKKHFQKEDFLMSVDSYSLKQLLQWFTETQMFEVFITNNLEKDHWDTVQLFMARILEKKENALMSPPSRSKGFGRKMKDFGKAIRTKLT